MYVTIGYTLTLIYFSFSGSVVPLILKRKFKHFKGKGLV